MEELLKVITDYGVTIGVVVYLIYFQLTVMKDLSSNMNRINESLVLMNERISDIEKKVGE